jgi:trypsin
VRRLAEPAPARLRRLAGVALAASLVAGATTPGSAAAAERPSPQAKASVVGGTNAPPDAYPWIVALSRGCGGTLIAPDRVLTAAHCVEEMRISDLRLYVGAHRRQRGGFRYDGRAVRADEVSSHPSYRPLTGGGPSHDVAVVRLTAPVEGVEPVELAAPADRSLYAAGREATVVGWGTMRSDLRTAPLATGLQHGPLRILSDASCNRIYGSDGSYRRSVMLCARSRQARRRPNTSPCVGDSGGPLLAGGRQIGIVSFGISCGALSEPTVYARVARLRSFIDAPEPVWAPQPLDRARVTGTLRPGRIATCQAPGWRNRVDRVRYRWGVNGLLMATGRRVRITRSALGRVLQCRAIGVNAGGATPSRMSPALRVAR